MNYFGHKTIHTYPSSVVNRIISRAYLLTVDLYSTLSGQSIFALVWFVSQVCMSEYTNVRSLSKLVWSLDRILLYSLWLEVTVLVLNSPTRILRIIYLSNHNPSEFKKCFYKYVFTLLSSGSSSTIENTVFTNNNFNFIIKLNSFALHWFKVII